MLNTATILRSYVLRFAQIAITLCILLTFHGIALPAKAGDELVDREKEKEKTKENEVEKVPQFQIRAVLLEFKPNTYISYKHMLDKSIKLMSKKEYADFMKSLEPIKGRDQMFAPRVVAKLDEPCKIEMVREFRYPTDYQRGKDGKLNPTIFEATNCGIELTLTPSLQGKVLYLKGAVCLTDFTGFTDTPVGAKTPSFDIRLVKLFREVGDDRFDITWLSNLENTDKPRLALVLHAEKLDDDAK